MQCDWFCPPGIARSRHTQMTHRWLFSFFLDACDNLRFVICLVQFKTACVICFVFVYIRKSVRTYIKKVIRRLKVFERPLKKAKTLHLCAPSVRSPSNRATSSWTTDQHQQHLLCQVRRNPVKASKCFFKFIFISSSFSSLVCRVIIFRNGLKIWRLITYELYLASD